MKNIPFLLIILINLSCYYSFREGTPTGKSLYIKPFTNQTSEPNLDQILTNELSKELSNLYILKNEELSEYKIQGSIIKITEDVYTYTSQETPKENKITITGRFELFKSSGEQIFKNDIEGWGIYFINGGNRDDAINLAIKMLKDKISDLMRSL